MSASWRIVEYAVLECWVNFLDGSLVEGERGLLSAGLLELARDGEEGDGAALIHSKSLDQTVRNSKPLQRASDPLLCFLPLRQPAKAK
jgi:hypothetical protein